MQTPIKPPPNIATARSFLARAAKAFASHPFKPHTFFQNGHAQTLAAFAWPRRRRFRSTGDEERVFQVAPDVQLLAHCRWQPNRNEHLTVVIWHGIEGSSASTYMLSTAHKAFQAGLNVIRMNLRSCGGTEHLTPTIYHGGLSHDLRVVVDQLIKRDGLSRIVMVGFSLGGNQVLKLAGEYGEHPPPQVLGICAVSPSVDLSASADLIMKRSNWLYHRDFVRRLKNKVRSKEKLFPELYDISRLDVIRTIKEFDDRFTSRAHGFADADDYYQRASSLRVIDRISIPTLIIHAEDDPFIPFAPLRDPAVSNNPFILLLAPKQGGHVAFIQADERADPDRFWAENRAIQFCSLASDFV
ncbi:MAG: alpha/beta fold hydrolase [Pyrinomonadaceae bacterium]|nr:alpha/beta fold hydrolase [Pyrinomonadaceae bacterium]